MPPWPNTERPAIWGFGREGRAAFAYLRAKGLDPAILDDAPLAEDLRPGQGEILIGAAAVQALRAGRFDLVVKSPGISLRRDEIAVAKNKGTVFTSPTNLWFAENPGARTIAVTGTKGKSTTARLIHHLLVKGGFDAALFGNVGTPALGQAPGRDVTVLELSSYQIADLDYAPDFAVFTNLYPEHAPWHGGHEAYYRDKLRLADLAGLTIANLRDVRLHAMLSGREVVWYEGAFGFSSVRGDLRFTGEAVACPGFSLPGAHNLSNLAAACTAADLFGAPNLRTRADLTGFVQLPHRLEAFSAGGIVCVDDSLSTLPEAAIAALDAYHGRRCALILGGCDRGQDHGGLVRRLAAADLACVLLLPATGTRIAKALRKQPLCCPVHECADLAAAVDRGFASLRVGDVLLMSPAAPSFGQFRDYAERGAHFKALCRQHAG